MEDDFEIKDHQNFFDFRGFLVKIVNYWPLLLVSLAISFYVAYYFNVRKQATYRMSNMVSVKDDQNPFFTSNTSLTFNWGGTTDKVQTAIIFLKSRSHNEKVVDYLQFYTDYLQQGEYHLLDVYGDTPFSIDINPEHLQLLDKTIKLTFMDSTNFDLALDFAGGTGRAQNMETKEIQQIALPEGNVKKRLALGDPFTTPYLSFKIKPTTIRPSAGREYLVKINSFDGSVGRYRNIDVDQTPSGSSVLTLTMNGTNKKRLVDYLNASIRVLSEDQLERKNLFATKTIKFIDSSLADKTAELRTVQNELDAFRDNNTSVGLGGDQEGLVGKVTDLDGRKQQIEQQLQYYRNLEAYLRTREDYGTDIPVPSLTGIGEGSISTQVGTIISLSEERKRLSYSAKPGLPIFDDLDRRINAVKTIIFENIASSKQILNDQFSSVRRDIVNVESQMRKLPAEQQQLMGIQRRYNQSESTYGVFLAKRSEAGIIKAANVSDIQVIDNAKDTGDGAIGPDTKTNYVMAAIAGSVLPIVFIFLLVFFDNKISNPEEIKKISSIPMLGAIGKSASETNLVVQNEPRSAVAEAFRAVRSSLQFIYRKQQVKGAKTVLVTSSVSGEGKTFCSINLATVFALSEKKTVLVGFDLRKPKIFDDFDLLNDRGVVTYLIGEHGLDQITQKTEVPFLDVILAGPIPPNPSELLLGEALIGFIDELKANYDYIILDTPPIGLVTDALELLPHVDATLYVVRQDYTKKGMLATVNEKYKNGEIKNISFVLNYFRTKGRFGYGYGYGYGYGTYGNGYTQETDKKDFGHKVKKIIRRAKKLFKPKD